MIGFVSDAIASPAANSWSDGFDSDGGGDPMLVLYLYLLGLATAVVWKLYLGKDSELRWSSIALWAVGCSFMWVIVFQLLALVGLPFIVVYELLFK